MIDLRVFEQMVAANPDRMSFVDANYIYREVNQAYLKDYQCRREDIIGKHISEFIGKEGFRNIKPLFDSCLAGEPVRTSSGLTLPCRAGGIWTLCITRIGKAMGPSTV